MTERNLHLVTDEEIDPELVGLKKFRPRIGPLLALSVLGLCVYLVISLRRDLVFGLGPKSPREFGDAATAYMQGSVVPDNAYVSVHGTPDFSDPAWLRGKEAVGHRLVPILGTSGALWVQIGDRPKEEAIAYDMTWTGRTRRLSDVSFGDQLTDWIHSLPPRARYVDPAALAQGMPMRDVAGDELAVTPETPVELDERIDGVSLITVYSGAEAKDAASAKKAIARAGLTPGDAPVSSTDVSWTYEVPGDVATVTKTIGASHLYAATVEEKDVPHQGAYKDLSIDRNAGVAHVGAAAVPISHVARVAVVVPPVIAKDARILLVGEQPGSYWYVAPLSALLGIFAMLMAWALVRSLRAVDEAPAPAPASTDP
jgi:hypothetical protein